MDKKADDELEVRTTFGGKAPITAEDLRKAEEKASEIARQRETDAATQKRSEKPDEKAKRELRESQHGYGKAKYDY